MGLALASGAPAAVLTTSGTAVGNLLPAVMEANHAAVPLVVISADRPVELRGTGANQTTVQLDLFGEHVRFAVDVPAGSDPRRAVETALSAATGAFEDTPPGPVQLNLAFRDPLVPAPGDRLPPESGRRVYRAPRGPLALDFPPASPGLPERRTVVLAGHDAGPVAEAFARAHGLPLLAEPSSNARFGPNAVGPYRILLDSFGPESAQPIERVVLFGRPTLSRPVSALLARADVPSALYQPVPVAWYEPGRRTELPLDNLGDLADFAGRGSAAWLDAWLLAGPPRNTPSTWPWPVPAATGPAVGALVWDHTRGQLVLGSSNGIRDVDLAGAPAPEPGAVGLRQPGPLRDRRDAGHSHRHCPGRPAGNHRAAGRRHVPARRRRAAARRWRRGAQPADRGPQRRRRGHLRAAGTRCRRGRGPLRNRRRTPLRHPAQREPRGTRRGVRRRAPLGQHDGGARRALAEPWEGRSIIEVRTERHGLRELHARIRAAVGAAVAGVLAAE